MISVSGEQSIALQLAGADVKGGVSNSRLLYASGAGARSVVLENSKLGPLVNGGVINAVGAQGVPDRSVTAIYVDNAQGYKDGNLGPAVIQNISTISSSGVGILNTGTSELVINNTGRGTIVGSIAAIDGGDHTTLNPGGGSVTGDILGLSQLNVLEDSSSIVTARSIEADSMNIGKNARLYLRTSQRSLKGDLHLANGSAVTVSAKPFDFVPTKDGVEYVLVKTGSISDSGVAISSCAFGYWHLPDRYSGTAGQGEARNFVLVSAPSGEILPGDNVQPLLPGCLLTVPSELLAGQRQIVVVENLQAMLDASRYVLPEELIDVPFVFRGSPQFSIGAVVDLAKHVPEVYYFPDADPKGLVNANKEIQSKGTLGPSPEAFQAMHDAGVSKPQDYEKQACLMPGLLAADNPLAKIIHHYRDGFSQESMATFSCPLLCYV